LILSIDSPYALVPEPRSQVPDTPVSRYDYARAYLSEREQHERSFMHARVGYLQSGLMDHLVAQQQQVEIQSPRAIAFSAHAAMPCFQREQLRQQLPWRKRAGQQRNGVDEVGLVQFADRCSSVQG
jgi:hypothetical protein